MSTVHERDIKEQRAKSERLIKAARLHLGDPPDPDMQYEQTMLARQIIETSGWMRKALSQLIGMPKATSKEQITLLYHVLDKIIYAWTAANNALEAFGLDDVEGPVDG
jgi:hypothetical protein